MKLNHILLPALALAALSQAFPATVVTGPLTARGAYEGLARESTDKQIEGYLRLLSASPDDLKLQAGLVTAYLQKLRESGDRTYLDRASKLVDRMLEADGGNFEALRFQNEIDLQLHNFQAVADRAQDMSQYAPSDAGNWGNLGDALMELGEYERAGQAFSRMFALRPNRASYNRLAYFRFVTGDPARGILLMRDAIEAGDRAPEKTAWCWAELGDMYFKTGALNDAAAAFENALKLFPTLHRASAGLGKVEAARGNVQAAIRNYKRAQSIVPLVEYAGALEDLYAEAGQKADARGQHDLISAIESLSAANNEKTNRNLALVLADHNRDLPTALHLLEAEIGTRGDVYTWDAYAWVLFKSGQIKKARAASDNALKLNTPEPGFYYHAVEISLAAGDQESARQYSTRLKSLDARTYFAKIDADSRTVH
jgi:tetratricopeptide (TPR) repeat protein